MSFVSFASQVKGQMYTCTLCLIMDVLSFSVCSTKWPICFEVFSRKQGW